MLRVKGGEGYLLHTGKRSWRGYVPQRKREKGERYGCRQRYRQRWQGIWCGKDRGLACGTRYFLWKWHDLVHVLVHTNILHTWWGTWWEGDIISSSESDFSRAYECANCQCWGSAPCPAALKTCYWCLTTVPIAPSLAVTYTFIHYWKGKEKSTYSRAHSTKSMQTKTAYCLLQRELAKYLTIMLRSRPYFKL